MRRFLFLAPVLLATMSATQSSAATFRVPSDYSKIEIAVSNALPGDTVLVEPGVYRTSFTISKNLVVTSEQGADRTFLVPVNASNDIITIAPNPLLTCEISGFTMSNALQKSAIRQLAGTSLIRDNVFTNNRGTTLDGAVIFISPGANAVLSSNLFHHNTADYIVYCGGVNITCVNNTIDDCARGLRLNSSNATVRNNVITRCSVYGIFAELPLTSADYNCLFDNTADYQGMSPNPNDILAAPLFVDTARSDHRLTASSPCIDAGDPDPSYNDPDNSRNDIGYVPYDGYIPATPTYATINVPLDYATIGDAVDAAVDGDTIRVAPGNYMENIFLRHKSLTVIGETTGGDTAMVLPADTNLPTIQISNGAADTRISGMHFVGSWGMSVILVTNGSPTIDHNAFVNNFNRAQEDGIIAVYDMPRSNAEIRFNLFSENSGAYTIWSPSDSIAIINNTIHKCVRGIGLNSPNAVVTNNIVTECSFYGLAVNQPPLVHDYNCVWNNARDYYFELSIGPNDLNSDPMFANSAVRNYALLPGSQCIDGGDPDPIYNDVDGTRCDVGAFPAAACCQGSTGDFNGDGIDVDPVDLSYLVDNLFGSGSLPWCPGEADIDADSEPGSPVDLSYLVDYLFSGGPDPLLARSRDIAVSWAMQRILIVGPPGAGKSTFAIKLAECTGLPLYHLDAIFWKPGWVMTDRDEFDAGQARLIQNDRWIIDGTYSRSLELRLTRADTAIYLDFPRPLYLRRVLWRMISGYGRVRQDMADGCPERLDFVFMKWCWNYRRNHRPNIRTMLDDFASRDEAELTTCAHPCQLDQLLDEISERLSSDA